MAPYRIIISGGGTGGHIYPAIAIANALREIEPDMEILFVGAKDRMEMQKVPAAGYRIIGLGIMGIQRRLTVKNLMFPFKVLGSLFSARRIIKDFNPDAVVGVGGYASGPILYAANQLGIPTAIQEQNSYAGITNKLLARKASKIFVAYEGMGRFFPENKTLLTGNPVRKDLLKVNGLRDKALHHFGLVADRPTLFVMGGSLGSLTINESVAAGLQKIVASGVQLLWQTGSGYYPKALEMVNGAGTDHVVVCDFINQMDLAYAVADTVISRAGALSISELALVGKPAVFVPLPSAAEDHQTSNAMSLVEADAALMVRDADARQTLVDTGLKLVSDVGLRETFEKNIAAMAKPGAAVTIAEEIIKLMK